MAILVGYRLDESATAALHLAGMLARSADDELVVCTVVVTPWPPNPERWDAEYRDLMDRAAERALIQARATVAADVNARFLVHHARSVPAGLLELAAELPTSLIVLGSSSGGVLGQVSLGGVTNRLLHSSHLPVALAAGGFRCEPDARVARVTAAYGGSGNSRDLVPAVANLAARVGATLRVASFAVSPTNAFGGSIEPAAEDLVVTEWVKGSAAAIRDELDAVSTLAEAPPLMETVIGHGFSWHEALADVPWVAGDILAVGSSISGSAARVFLGSRASKIMRHSPVPVVLVPREAMAELAGA